MAYVCTLVTLIALAVKGFCGKAVSTFAKDGTHALLFNLIRVLLCIPISLAVLLLLGRGESLLPPDGLLAISLLAGAANAAFLAFWMLAVQKNTMVAVDVTLTMGSLLPALLCALLFSEAITPTRLLGFALILLAAFVLGKGGERKKGGPFGVLFVLLAALGEGMVGFSQQLYRQYYTETGARFTGTAVPSEVYHLYTYLFAGAFLLLGTVAFRLFAKKDGQRGEEKSSAVPWHRVLLHIAVMAACLFLANYAQTAASAVYGMPSEVLYPVVRGGTLILVNVTALFFGERFTPRTALGTLIALGGILVMNLL